MVAFGNAWLKKVGGVGTHLMKVQHDVRFPLVKHFDDAAELAAAYVADQINDAGYTAAWWEVKNESSVQSEWAHHWQEKKGIDGWGLLADFHNRVATAVHERAPGIKVGGPSSAYMQLQVKDFALYRSQARFIEETRGKIDFFSHHFYENALMLGAHERRGLGYSNYLLGRYEAILDMLRAHMHKVDNVLPILITECGSLQNGRQPSDNWLRLYAWNAYLTKSMQRPDQIDPCGQHGAVTSPQQTGCTGFRVHLPSCGPRGLCVGGHLPFVQRGEEKSGQCTGIDHSRFLANASWFRIVAPDDLSHRQFLTSRPVPGPDRREEIAQQRNRHIVDANVR